MASVKHMRGPEDPTVLDARYRLGRLLESVETVHPPEGLDQTVRTLEEIYDGRAEQLGVDDPDTLRAGYTLSVILDQTGRYTDARKLKLDILERRREVLGTDHADTLQSASDPSLTAQLVAPPSAERQRMHGPFDSGDVPDDDERLNLGAVRIPRIDGVEVRVQETDGSVVQLVLVEDDNAVQIGVFAAPPDEGIWSGVQAEIEDGLRDEGNAPERRAGPYGEETFARVSTSDGSANVRFVGIDGPGWMLRALYQGPVAIDPKAAPKLVEIVRGVVVDRGTDVMPVRAPLPMRLPAEVKDLAPNEDSS